MIAVKRPTDARCAGASIAVSTSQTARMNTKYEPLAQASRYSPRQMPAPAAVPYAMQASVANDNNTSSA